MASRDLQLQMWRQKAAKLEEQLAIARKGESDAIEKAASTEQRILRFHKAEADNERMREEVAHLKEQLKGSADAQVKALWLFQVHGTGGPRGCRDVHGCRHITWIVVWLQTNLAMNRQAI